MAVNLRPYQETGVQNIRSAMGKNRRVLFVLPTGGGKTVTFSYIAWSAQKKGKRIYIAAHRAEIVEQISRALAQFNVQHGRIQPGRTLTADAVQVCMIQTLSRRLEKMPAPDMLIYDECHHAVTGAYVAVANHFPNARILGVTATPERLDGRGLGEAFDIMVQGPPSRWLIENNFLADFDYYAPATQLDLSSVKTSMGDYALDDLAKAVDKPTITGDAITHYRRFLDGRPAIAFCVTVEHAKHVAATFNEAGIAAASIDGTMSGAERDAVINGLKSGAIKVMTSCELISEGFDVPAVSGAILLRPTKSLAMSLQQAGRALRLKPDGSKAVILDHVGNVNRFGTPKTDRQWSLDSKKRKAEESGVHACKACFKVFDHDEFISRKESGAGCGEPEEGCIFVAKERSEGDGAGREIEQVAGELTAITESPAWAQGINIARAAGAEFKEMLAKADTLEKLKEIARIRGYHWKWAARIMSARSGEELDINTREVEWLTKSLIGAGFEEGEQFKIQYILSQLEDVGKILNRNKSDLHVIKKRLFFRLFFVAAQRGRHGITADKLEKYLRKADLQFIYTQEKLTNLTQQNTISFLNEGVSELWQSIGHSKKLPIDLYLNCINNLKNR